jgi:hypothetical protein
VRLPIPGPGAVIGGAAAAAEAVETAISLVPRAADALTRVEALLDRVGIAVDRVEAVVDRAEAVAGRADAVAAEAAESTTEVRAAVDAVAVVTRDAGRRVDAAGGLVDRLDTLLGTWEPVGRKLAPQASRLADGLSGQEVDSAIALIDRMPVVLEHLDNDLLPVLRTLDRVGPDLHELLEVVEDLRRVVTGLPGVGRRQGLTRGSGGTSLSDQPRRTAILCSFVGPRVQQRADQHAPAREVEPTLSTEDTIAPDPARSRPADPRFDADARIRQLEEALESHALVDQARGVLMATHRIDADAAWGLLVRVSSHQNIRVRTLAEAVITLMTSPVPAEPSPATSAAIRYLLPRDWRDGATS